MRRAPTSLTIGTLLWIAVSSAHAIGFGRVSNTTLLGQSLNFEALVRLGPDETLTPECVLAEVSAGENRIVQPLINVQVETLADPGLRRIRVRTSNSIDEPVVTVQLTLGCDGKVTRKFVAFVDPPEFRLAQSSEVGQPPAASAPAPAAEPAVAVAAAPTPAAVKAPTQPRSTARPARRAGGSVQPTKRRSTAVAAAPQTRRSAPTGASMARPAPEPVSRLKLEPAPPILSAKAASAPSAPPIATASAASAAPTGVAASSAETVALAASAPASAASAAAEQVAAELLAGERSRLQALEESFKRVRDETQAAQKALLALQARVKEAEAQRYANPLVYALAAISALLALAVAGLWWRQARAQREAKWWGTVAPSMAAASELPSSVQDSVREEARTSGFAALSEPPDLPRPSSKVVVAPEPAKVVWADSRQTEPAPDLVPEPRRDLSVEELIDLEQQAEFFVVLGQDDAAIDLLMGHVRSTGGISPLPYLKLLEIYRRRGDRSAYERIRERFNRRFNAYAPDWDADLQQGRSLEDYPATIARLEALWVMPQRVMETLEASLFRRDETEEAFDLPAYRELLFLYAVARDFANRSDDSSAVDLLLPMDTDAPSAPVSRLVASLPSMMQNRSTSAAKPDADSGLDFALDGEAAGASASVGGPSTLSGLSVDLGSLGLVDDAKANPKPGGSGSN
jgi:pilus assembly protein FimV